jgi:hypothetical protein
MAEVPVERNDELMMSQFAERFTWRKVQVATAALG